MRLRVVFNKYLDDFRQRRSKQISLEIYSQNWLNVLLFFWVRNAGYLFRQFNQFLRAGVEYSVLLYLTGASEIKSVVFGALILELVSRSYQENITLQIRNFKIRGAGAFGKSSKIISCLFPLLMLFAYYAYILRAPSSRELKILLIFKGIEQLAMIGQFFATYELQSRKRIYFPPTFNFFITGLISCLMIAYSAFENQKVGVNILVVGSVFLIGKLSEIALSYYYYVKAEKMDQVTQKSETTPKVSEASKQSKPMGLVLDELNSNWLSGLLILMSKYWFLACAVGFGHSIRGVELLLFAIGIEALMGKFIERAFRSVYIDIVASFQKGNLYHIEKLLSQSFQLCLYLCGIGLVVLIGLSFIYPKLLICLPWIMASLIARAFFYFVYSIGIDEQKLFAASMYRYAAAVICAILHMTMHNFSANILIAIFSAAEILGVFQSLYFFKKFEFSQFLRINIQKYNLQRLEDRNYGVPLFFELKTIMMRYFKSEENFSVNLKIHLWTPVRNAESMQKVLFDIRKTLRVHDLVIAENPQVVNIFLSDLNDLGLEVVKKKLLGVHPMMIQSISAERLAANSQQENKNTSLSMNLDNVQAKFRSLILDFQREIEEAHHFYTKDQNGLWRSHQSIASKELQFNMIQLEERFIHWPFLEHAKTKKIHGLKMSILPVVINGQLIGYFSSAKLNSVIILESSKLQKKLAALFGEETSLKAIAPDLFRTYCRILQSLFNRLNFATKIQKLTKAEAEKAILYCELADKSCLAFVATGKLNEAEKKGLLVNLEQKRVESDLSLNKNSEAIRLPA